MSTLDASSSPTLAELVARAKLYMRLGGDDTSLHEDAIAVYALSPLTSATVAVTDTTVVCTDNLGTLTMTMADAASDTLAEIVSQIDARANWNATLLGKSDANSNTLVRRAATSCLAQANEVTLTYEVDTLLELLLKDIWAGIETYLDRDILTTAFSELYRVEGDQKIILRVPNVTQVSMIAMETEDGLYLQYTGSDEHARVEVTSTAVVLTSRTGSTTTTTTTLFSAQATTTAMATTIAAVAGWTATVVNARPSAFLVRQGVRDAKQRVTLEVWDDWDGEYRVEYDEGIITLEEPALQMFSNAAKGMARIDYTAGYTTMPGDVELALLEAVKASWDSGGIDVNLNSERIGDYSYTIREGAALQAASTTTAAQAAKKLWTKYARVRP